MNPPFSILAGNLVRFFVDFTNEAGTLTDPSVVSIEVGSSDLDAQTLTPVHDATGKYHADWDTTGALEGTYYLKATGIGALVVANEVPVRIRVPHLTG